MEGIHALQLHQRLLRHLSTSTADSAPALAGLGLVGPPASTLKVCPRLGTMLGSLCWTDHRHTRHTMHNTTLYFLLQAGGEAVQSTEYRVQITAQGPSSDWLTGSQPCSRSRIHALFRFHMLLAAFSKAYWQRLGRLGCMSKHEQGARSMDPQLINGSAPFMDRRSPFPPFHVDP